MVYFLILVLVGTLLWLMRSYLAEEDNDYYRHSPVERTAHSIGLGFVTAAVIWVMTALMVRNVWVDANFKKVVVAEIETYKLVETKGGERIVIADDGETAYEVKDLSVSDFGSSDAKLRSKRLRDHLSCVNTFPGVLKYLSQTTELRPLLDFWEELRVIQGGLL